MDLYKLTKILIGLKWWMEWMTHIFVLTRLYHVHQPLDHLLFIQPLQWGRTEAGVRSNQATVYRQRISKYTTKYKKLNYEIPHSITKQQWHLKPQHHIVNQVVFLGKSGLQFRCVQNWQIWSHELRLLMHTYYKTRCIYIWNYSHWARPVWAAVVRYKSASWAAGPWWPTCRCVL